MSWAHKLMDGCLWTIAILWLCEFLSAHRKWRRIRLNAPSLSCERTPDWRVNLPALARRQAD